jgi:hypothetical protein
MSTLNPTIPTRFYNFDYYEVAYTGLGTQYPVIGDVKFPNFTFANSPKYINAVTTTSLSGTPTPTTIDGLFTQSILNKDTINIKDTRANNIITNNIGLEFYTRNWEDSLNLCKEINYIHTYNANIPGTYPTEAQKKQAIHDKWQEWWDTLVSSGVNLDTFHTPLSGSRLDTVTINGRLITPNTAHSIRTGSTIIKAQDLFNRCVGNQDVYITYSAFSNSLSGSYGSCFVVINGENKNWTLNAKLDNPYGLKVTPRTLTDTSGTITIHVPQSFFVAMRNDPELLNTEFTLYWNINLTTDGACLANLLIDKYIHVFYPYYRNLQLYYLPKCGIIFDDALGYSDAAINALDEMKILIRYLFNSYNCYAREVSKNNEYGDIIRISGNLYNEHGSECWIQLKQVLRPTIQRYKL